MRRHAATREPLRVAAPLLLPFGAATADDDVEEPFDAMWALVTALSEGGWSSAHLLAPHRAFEKKLDEAPQHPLPLVTIPPHERGTHLPELLASAVSARRLSPPRPTPAPARGGGGGGWRRGGGGGEDGGGGGGGGGERGVPRRR